MKPDIATREDIILFVDEFYGKVRQDELLGPVFNDVITDWKLHLDKMYRFWNAVLFGAAGYKGNPFAKHAPLPVGAIHFDRWLDLFRQTIDSHFAGEMATDTKTRAAVMAAMFIHKLSNMKGGADKVLV